MNLLAPHLPPGFVPRRPSAKTLERFRAWCGQTGVAPNMEPDDDLWMYSLYPRKPTLTNPPNLPDQKLHEFLAVFS
jgi:hypothetical protein